MQHGWIIGLRIEGEERAYALFAVAEADQEKAAAIVAAAVSARGANEIVEVAGPISKAPLDLYGLKPGEWCAIS